MKSIRSTQKRHTFFLRKNCRLPRRGPPPGPPLECPPPECPPPECPPPSRDECVPGDDLRTGAEPCSSLIFSSSLISRSPRIVRRAQTNFATSLVIELA